MRYTRDYRAITILLAATAGLAACNVTQPPSTAILSKDEFQRTVEFNPQVAIAASTAPRALEPARATSVTPPLDSEAKVELTGPIAASSGIDDAVAQPGPPATVESTQVVSNSVLVDAKIGEINGRAIYASEFLEPMSDRLRAEAGKQNRNDWLRFARTEITRELDTMIEYELLTAEALSSLTPEQKQGFFAFMQSIGRRVQSQNAGSRTLTNQRLQESSGKTLDQMMAERREAELIKFQLQERVYKRVNISWRDIRQTYERFYDEFNPPPTYIFRLIQIRKDDEAAIKKVTDGMAAGEAFDKLALSEDNLAYYSRKEQQAIREVPQDRENPANTTFFVNKSLNSAAAEMKVGDVKGPIDTTPTTSWLKLEQIIEDTTPLYEAQIGLENLLRKNRNDMERRKYIAGLRSRASISSTEEMTERLLAIASDRFYPAPLE
ncbi:MAG: peptidyl-prolyl cis-trans isomerase [Phycisphaerales bacterium]